MDYIIEYHLDGEWIDNIWLGESHIDVSLSVYSISNNTYDDEFGTVWCPDYIEDCAWEVVIKTLNFNWLKKWSIEQMENIINNDELFFEVVSDKILEALKDIADDAEMDKIANYRRCGCQF